MDIFGLLKAILSSVPNPPEVYPFLMQFSITSRVTDKPSWGQSCLFHQQMADRDRAQHRASSIKNIHDFCHKIHSRVKRHACTHPIYSMRKLRMLRDGAEYHVTARINRSEMILLPEEEKILLLMVINRAKKRYRFQIKNFCIMNNHLHFLIKPGENESLSRIMQWILSVFAMAWNRKHNLKGHVWGERFYSRIISGIVDFLRVFIYIDDNPVNAKLVDQPQKWQFGGLWHHKHRITTVTDPPDELVLQYCPEHTMS